MNVLDFNILSGWPGSTETWQYLQNMILNSQNTGLLGGKNYIVSGCVEAGGNVGNGLIVVNGEMLPFEGGPTQPKIIVVDEPVTRAFFGGAVNPYYHNRKAVFGSGPGEVLYSDFKRNDPDNGVLARLDKVERMLKPLMAYDVAGTPTYGSWLFWGRPAGEIPAGWEAVPDADWKGKVPVVLNSADADFDTVGETGGFKTHTLTGVQQGSIKFKGKIDDISGGTANAMAEITVNGVIIPRNGAGNQTGDGTEITVPLNNDAAPHNNLQPYKVVMFIRFTG